MNEIADYKLPVLAPIQREADKYRLGEFNMINPAFDKVRRIECLCYRCTKLVPEYPVAPAPLNCTIAERLFKLCKDTGIATLLTKCPEFVEKNG